MAVLSIDRTLSRDGKAIPVRRAGDVGAMDASSVWRSRESPGNALSQRAEAVLLVALGSTRGITALATASDDGHKSAHSVLVRQGLFRSPPWGARSLGKFVVPCRSLRRCCS
ncbi:unnamed protein product [Ostreobium quekettii]|uniref:Uncharacterized protein n=1 Tax=Ostreobium quekettii TaxID=121088 RepID=A0A8S1J4E1_9CHLO|nr:unnamed protein product [Ostreobium quekettii]